MNTIAALILGQSEYYDSINGHQHARATVEKILSVMYVHSFDKFMYLFAHFEIYY